MPVCIYLFQIPCLKHSLPQRILRRLCSTTVRLLLAVYSIFQRLTPNKLYQPFQFKPFLRSRFEKRHWGLFFFGIFPIFGVCDDLGEAAAAAGG